MIYVGNLKIRKVYVGNLEVPKIYINGYEVYPISSDKQSYSNSSFFIISDSDAVIGDGINIGALSGVWLSDSLECIKADGKSLDNYNYIGFGSAINPISSGVGFGISPGHIQFDSQSDGESGRGFDSPSNNAISFFGESDSNSGRGVLSESVVSSELENYGITNSGVGVSVHGVNSIQIDDNSYGYAASYVEDKHSSNISFSSGASPTAGGVWAYMVGEVLHIVTSENVNQIDNVLYIE